MAVNDSFTGFPIDFFTFSNENFNPSNSFEKKYFFTEEDLELEEGFIGNSLFKKINFDEKDTTIVNCAVGQGKTHAILHSIKEYLNTEDSIDTYFVIAVPLVSLVTQYKNDLLNMGYDENQIFVYDNIADNVPESGQSYLNIGCKIHIVTVNTLLGNAGEHAIMQSNRKYNYVKAFAEELSTHGKKLIIVYDEIHEAIRNFNETGVAHLSHISSVILKNILLSATYNVQSIPVIKLLSHHTNNKIRLLEADRVVTKPQSKLFLHFNNEYSSSKYSAITDLILRLVGEGKKIDVLSFSKKLCQNLLNLSNEPGRTLQSAFGNLRACVSTIKNNEGDNDEDLTRNRFDNNFCNIGTNFKSGVNIKKENHAFIIVLPPAIARSTYSSFNGIFSEGPNSVIQALARQRTTGEIHVILPKPIIMDFESLPEYMSESQKQEFEEVFTKVSIPTTDVQTSNNVEVLKTSYIPFSKHIDEVDKWWEILKERYKMPMVLNLNVKLPPYDGFVITNGEKCTTKTNFLGKDIAGFVVYSALTNQFFNAKLEDFFLPEVVTLENLQAHLENIYDSIESNNISEVFSSIERSVDLSAMSTSQKRTAKQAIFNYVIQKQSNIEDLREIEITSAYKFVMSYFDRFRNEIRGSLENQIIRFKSLANQNIEERGEERFYKPYNQFPIFSNQAIAIRYIISSLKEFYPLDKDFTNFFDNYSSSTDQQVEKKFYEFIIAISAETNLQQRSVNGITGYFHKIIRIF
ncbi:DEAD/DEAH box helicase [Chryseobacterium sp.]|uniref:DEAD/DEAH box helicase n=1 Tax=Chryseobacterium sp. TaxID=1871047 RepID=UPI00388FCA68